MNNPINVIGTKSGGCAVLIHPTLCMRTPLVGWISDSASTSIFAKRKLKTGRLDMSTKQLLLTHEADDVGKKLDYLPMTGGTCNQKRDFINTLRTTCYQNSGFGYTFIPPCTRIDGFMGMNSASTKATSTGAQR
jgi:hypothetical protein